jgi:hypothetical protein
MKIILEDGKAGFEHNCLVWYHTGYAATLPPVD